MTIYVPPLPVQNFLPKQTVVTSLWLNAIDNILQGNVPAKGVYNPAFQQGQVQVTGPDGNTAAYGDFTFSLLLPNATGTPYPGISIAGAGKSAGVITTDAQIPGQNGILLLIQAGSTAVGSGNTGGNLYLLGGASSNGIGGPAVLQAGTSVGGAGGDTTILGGNSTNGPAGNVYIVAGETGTQGGNIKLIPTSLPGPTGTPGSIIFQLGTRAGSLSLWTFSYTGALFPGNQGAGNIGDVLVSQGNLASPVWGPVGLRGSFPLTLSGATLFTPTGTFQYASDGRRVSIWSDAPLTSTTSGPNDIILSTIPSFLWPAAQRVVPCNFLVNNFTGFAGQALISSVGGITISLLQAAAGNGLVSIGTGGLWVASAGLQKGIANGWTITYPI